MKMNKEMKKITILTFALASLLAASCVKPEFVEPTASRQGLTSLEAIFTFGPYRDQTMGLLTITDDSQERFVIPVPWFYPETSDDETTLYMTKVRVKAGLEPNYSIDPPITLLNLTEENWFTFTDPDGNSRQICITGERVKSAACELQAFSIDEPALTGVIDASARKVSLVSADDLSSCTAVAQVSAHATISPNPAEPRSYNTPVEFTVTAHDGTTTSTWTVVKEQPEKIDYGFNSTTVTPLFNFDPASHLSFPAYTETVYPTMAMAGGKLVVCLGSGTPVYLNSVTGVREGEINLGSATAAAIASDEGGNMLICNHAESNGTVNIWKTRSVTEAPELFHSFTNESDTPMGYKMKIMGNIDTEAQIVITNEGIDGVTTSSRFTAITVSNGAVTSTVSKDIATTGLGWGAAPVNNTAVVASSVNPEDGYYLSYYDPNQLTWINGNLVIGAQMPTDIAGSVANGNVNANSLDSKAFNNARYVAWFITSHFPMWGTGPQLYLYDISNPSVIVEHKPVLANSAIEWYQTAASGVAAGDVIISPSADGFMLYVYYYDHNSGVIGGYSADCIKR